MVGKVLHLRGDCEPVAAAGFGRWQLFSERSPPVLHIPDTVAHVPGIELSAWRLANLPHCSVTHAPVAASNAKDFREALSHAGSKALGGGVPGLVSMAVNVCGLMWLHTTMNYQYRYGVGTFEAMRTLYREGGVRRFYRGVGPALVQGPLSRFGDTAANSGVLAFLEQYEQTAKLPLFAKTAFSSMVAASWRIVILPLDTLKTVSQVQGRSGLAFLRDKIRRRGVPALYHGALASASATYISHYPWFVTYNYLNARLPQRDDAMGKTLRSALMGLCCAIAADCTSNPVRVVKTTRQTSDRGVGYFSLVKELIAKDGLFGFWTRGLQTRVAANCIQSICFSVMWRFGQDYWARRFHE